MSTEPAEPDLPKQISVRLPASLITSIDNRRKSQGISRDEWMRRATLYCLDLPAPKVTP